MSPIGAARVSRFSQVGAIPDSVQNQFVANNYSENTAWTDDIAGATLSEVGSPTKTAGALNNNDIIFLDGADDAFEDTQSEVTLNQPDAIVAVARHISGVDGAGNFWAGATDRQLFEADSGSGGGWASYAGATLLGGTVGTNWHIFNVLYDGTGSNIRVDGADVATGDAGTQNLAGTILGASNNLSEFHEMEIAEIWFMQSPSTQDRDDADAQLNDKYALY